VKYPKTGFRLMAVIVLLLLFVAAPAFAEDGERLAAPVTYQDVLQIGVPIVSLLVAVAAWIRKGNVQQADQSATIWLQQHRADRDYMEKLERAYEQSNETQRKMFDTFASTIKVISPYTPFGFDDEASKFMADMQQRGAGPAAGGSVDGLKPPHLE
jgi:hypothetical protein